MNTNKQITESINNLVIKTAESIEYLFNDLKDFKSYLITDNKIKLLKTYFELELDSIKLDTSSFCKVSTSIINLLDLVNTLINEDTEDIKDNIILPLETNFQSFIDLQTLYFNLCYYNIDQDCDSCNYLDKKFETEVKELIIKYFIQLKELFTK